MAAYRRASIIQTEVDKMSQDKNDVDAIIKELREYIDRLNEALSSEIPKGTDEVKQQYKDIIN